jgi:phospholipid transport system substrate-binding protein
VNRNLFCLLLAALLLFVTQVHAQSADPAARVKSFYASLLETMKDAKRLGIEGRYKKLAPAVTAAFDLPAMTRIAVGPAWTAFTPEQQAAVTAGFTRMTIATYASRFDDYDGERFEVDPKVAERGADRVVHTRIVTSREAVTLNYLMRSSRNDWKIVDVYLSGTISELAVRRSEFGAVLKSGGAEALASTLKARGDKLMAGG